MARDWNKLIISFLIGALAPCLVAWGSMRTNITRNKEQVDTKVSTKVFEEFKDGNEKAHENILRILTRIDGKLK